MTSHVWLKRRTQVKENARIEDFISGKQIMPQGETPGLIMQAVTQSMKSHHVKPLHKQRAK